MKTTSPWWQRPAGAFCAGLLALVTACGGVEGGGTGAQQGYSQGSITGFGSIIVNDIHFDESAATVVGEDGVTPLKPTDLKLGMSVEVQSGGIDTATASAIATAVQLRSHLLGAVVNPNATAGTFTVVGQPVQVTSATVFDTAITGGLAGVAAGSLVEVHAVYDPVTGLYSARRIEPVASANLYRVRGMVSQLTSNTFQIGSAVFVYNVLPAGLTLTEGVLARVQVLPTPDAQGRWVVSGLAKGERQPTEGARADVGGVVTAYTSLSQFSVDGVPVNASGAVVSPAGATLAQGSWVKVEGVMSVGVLVATEVEVKSADKGRGGDDNDSGDDDHYSMELKGRVASIDTVAQTFRIRDSKTGALREPMVSYAKATYPEGGSAALLVNDAKVEVKGKLSADGHLLVAPAIKFDN